MAKRTRIAVGLLLAACFCGCVSRYQVTLTNSHVITTKSRPRLNDQKSAYTFKDAQGQVVTIPVFRIREINPL